MKILLVSPLPPPSGGIATWTVRYQRYCLEHNVPLTIINNALQGARKAKSSTKRHMVDELRRAGRIIGELIRQLRREKPDIVHLNTSCSRFGIFRDLICAVIAGCASVPVVLHCHCNIQDQLHGRAAVLAFKLLANRSARVLTLNRFSAEYAKAYMPERVLTIPNFTDEDSLFERKQVLETIGRVVFVGYVRSTKGAVEILETAKRLPSVEFLMIGPVHEEIAAMGHSSNVVILGSQPRETVLQHLKDADVFLFPSYTEGFANALLEAMASGLPVIATDVGANAEMIENKGGVIVPKGDAAALANAIEQLADDPASRMQMAMWNIAKVKRCYLLDTVMDKLFTVYAQVIE